MEIKEIEFSKLRHAYIVVKTFIESDSFEKIRSLDTKLAKDLSLLGDDNLELLGKFVRKFELDHKEFQYDKHFHSEDELYGSGAAILRLLNLSIWLSLKTIQLLTFNRVKTTPPDFATPKRQVSDMTFKDLLTWYIEKKYKPSLDIKYKLIVSADK